MHVALVKCWKAAVLVAFIASGLWFAQRMLVVPSNNAPLPHIRIATTNGVAAELLEKMSAVLRANNEATLATDNNPFMEVFTVQDCCAASTPWSMGSNAIQGAIMCPDAAAQFLASNSEFVLLGPITVNSDVVIVHNTFVAAKDDAQDVLVGVSHKRQHQVLMAQATFGNTVRIAPMLTQALAYAFKDNKVDAAIVDVSVAKRLQAWIIPQLDENIITQVLVVNKQFAASKDFVLFTRAYKQARPQLLATYATTQLMLPEHLGTTTP